MKTTTTTQDGMIKTQTVIRGHAIEIGINEIGSIIGKDCQVLHSQEGFVVVLGAKYKTVNNGIGQQFYLFAEQEAEWCRAFTQGNAREFSTVTVTTVEFPELIY